MKARTFGSSLCFSSSGRPWAIMVLRSASRNTALSPSSKMLGSSWVTSTIVVPAVSLSSRRLDDLVLELRDSLGTTIVLVTHELPSIFELGDNAVFLDAEKKTMTARGRPAELKDNPDPKVRAFLTRGRL